MATALRIAYDAMPEPRLVAALGDCALGCGVLGYQAELAGALEDLLPVEIRIPGCPPSPEVIARHLLAGLDQR
jgi:Ni,Fe-hydrogenase III small subunit